MDYFVAKPRIEGRTAKRILVLGGPGTGKSNFSYVLMQHAGKGLMVLADYDDWAAFLPKCAAKTREDFNYSDVRHLVYESEEQFEAIDKHFYNGMICVDDCKNYIPSNTQHSRFMKIVRRTRQKRTDLIIQAHSFKDVPPSIFPFITEYVIFNIEDSPASRRKEISEDAYNALCRVVDDVKRKYKENPQKNKHYFKRLKL